MDTGKHGLCQWLMRHEDCNWPKSIELEKCRNVLVLIWRIFRQVIPLIVRQSEMDGLLSYGGHLQKTLQALGHHSLIEVPCPFQCCWTLLVQHYNVGKQQILHTFGKSYMRWLLGKWKTTCGVHWGWRLQDLIYGLKVAVASLEWEN